MNIYFPSVERASVSAGVQTAGWYSRTLTSCGLHVSNRQERRCLKYDIIANGFEEQQVQHHRCADICLRINYEAFIIHHVNVPHAFASCLCLDLLPCYINMHLVSLCSKLSPASPSCLHHCAIYLFTQTLEAGQAASSERCTSAAHVSLETVPRSQVHLWS